MRPPSGRRARDAMCRSRKSIGPSSSRLTTPAARSTSPKQSFSTGYGRRWEVRKTKYEVRSTEEEFDLSHVYSRPAVRVRFRFSEHFAAHRCGVTFAEGQELEQVGNRIAFRPAEIGVRNAERAVP